MARLRRKYNQAFHNYWDLMCRGGNPRRLAYWKHQFEDWVQKIWKLEEQRKAEAQTWRQIWIALGGSPIVWDAGVRMDDYAAAETLVLASFADQFINPAEQRLHDEVFDPGVSDLEYFMKRKEAHGL